MAHRACLLPLCDTISLLLISCNLRASSSDRNFSQDVRKMSILLYVIIYITRGIMWNYIRESR